MYRDKGSGIFAIIAEANLREVEPDDARRWAEQSAPAILRKRHSIGSFALDFTPCFISTNRCPYSAIRLSLRKPLEPSRKASR